jgi:hypothetical protein
MAQAGRPHGARHPGGLVAGCAATITALNHTDLDVQTRMSETIFLDPAMCSAACYTPASEAQAAKSSLKRRLVPLALCHKCMYNSLPPKETWSTLWTQPMSTTKMASTASLTPA